MKLEKARQLNLALQKKCNKLQEEEKHKDKRALELVRDNDRLNGNVLRLRKHLKNVGKYRFVFILADALFKALQTIWRSFVRKTKQ